jgi:hypothetical protein
MNKQAIITVLITALTFVSCRPTARQTVADAEQPTDSTEAVTSADTLRDHGVGSSDHFSN